MKRFLSVVLAVIMIFTSGIIFATDTSETTQNGTIKVGINAEFPPFEYYEDGILTGFDIDLMNQIGSRAGYSIEYVDIPFDSLIPAVLSGRIDCAISLISVTEERDKVIDYSRKYLMTNIITYNNGEMSKKRGEHYAIVFREGLSGSPYEDLENPTDDENLYIAVDEALKDLSQDKTVRKLMEKYGLDKPLKEADKTIEY